jgi:hypothetical protein
MHGLGTAARDSSEPTGTSSAGASSSSSSSKAGPIAGGVIGGLALLGALAGVAFWLRRRQQQKQQPPIAPTTYAPTYPPSSTGSPPPGGPAGMSEYGTNSTSFASPIAGSNYGATPMRLYDPADPSTFPDAPTSVGERLEPVRPSIDYVSQPAGTSSNPFQTPAHVVHSAYPASVGASSSGAAGYKGVPEV